MRRVLFGSLLLMLVALPLSAQTPIGKASIVVDGATIATHDLYPSEDVPAGGFFRRTVDTVRLWFN